MWALFEDRGVMEVGRGLVERIGKPDSFAEWHLDGKTTVKHLKVVTPAAALRHLLNILAWHKYSLKSLRLVGHHITHGGVRFTKPTRLTGAVVAALTKLNTLAPLDNPIELELAQLARQMLPRAKHVAVFETAWFRNLPVEARTYALPLALRKRLGLERYGFHGISHAYVAQEAARRLNRPLTSINIITCSVGSSASVVAVRSGRAIDTSAGFSPHEGLMAGSRAGEIDWGLVLHLLKQPGFSRGKLDQILTHESGFRGLAGVKDVREVLVRAGYEVLGFKEVGKVSAQDEQKARLALKVFLYRVQKYIGAYAAILGQVDAIVFTGTIGERNEVVRNLVMRGLPTLRAVPVLGVPANEELAIARAVASV